MAIVLEHCDVETRICFTLTNKTNATAAFELLKRPDHWDYDEEWLDLVETLRRDGWFNVS
jgi:hypothetical protein